MKRYSVFLSLMALSLFLLAIPTQVGAGTVKGRVLMIDKSTPMADGVAIFFDYRKGPPPEPGVAVHPPDFVEPLDSEGCFQVTLPAGEYYFGAIKRNNTNFGPPESGDIFFIKRDRPIMVSEEFPVELGDITEISPL